MPGLLAAMLLLVLPAGIAGLMARYPRAAAGVDGMMVAAVVLLVGGSIVPDAVQGGGWGALALFAAGLTLPTVAERVGVGHARVDVVSMGVAWLVLVLHSLVDGVALASAGSAMSPLALSIAIHQVPVGLAVFGFQQSRLGRRGAVAVLVALALATALGFVVGERIVAAVSHPTVSLFQGFAAGFVLHLVGHGPLPGAGGRVGVRLLGAALVLFGFVAAHRAGLVIGEGGRTDPNEGLSMLLAAVSLAVVLTVRAGEGRALSMSSSAPPPPR